jgi:hypothetical protein
MSEQDLWKAIGRSQVDLKFSAAARNNPEQSVLEYGFKLEPQELDQFKGQIGASRVEALLGPDLTIQPPGAGPMPLRLAQQFWEEQQKFMHEAMTHRLALSVKMMNVVGQTFDSASRTFRTITVMSWITFAVGVALFVFAAILAAFTHAQVYSILFGGLGATSFVALFIRHPVDRVQQALANLVQVEVVFISYFDQVSWWEGLSNIPKENQPDPEHIERASAGLQQRTAETMDLLQRIIERTSGKARAQTRTAKEPHRAGPHVGSDTSDA